MSKTIYKLDNGAGIVHKVQHGLVEREGAFFYLLDTGEVRHFKFSNESELITALHEEIARLEREKEKMQHDMDNLSRRCDYLRDKLAAARAEAERGERGVKV